MPCSHSPDNPAISLKVSASVADYFGLNNQSGWLRSPSVVGGNRSYAGHGDYTFNEHRAKSFASAQTGGNYQFKGNGPADEDLLG